MGDRRHSRRDPMASPNKTKKARPPPLRSVCVYCGSNVGTNTAYAAAAHALGAALARERVGLVYGGGGRGLMGELARSVLEAGGRVTGIIPAFLSEREHMLKDANELIVVDDMHQRKKLMFDRSDAFVAMPGGIGTLEELVEQLTWAQLGRHSKPIVLLNIDQFWDPFVSLLHHMTREAFIRPDMDVRYVTVDAAEAVLPAITEQMRQRPAKVQDTAVTSKL